ncbi:MAG TPA: hypothetical protein VGK46_09565 [Saprospiraceae bacterium]
MPRLRSFDLPHKALRNVIAKFSFHLGSANPSDPAELVSLKQLANEMFTLLHNHVHTENEHTLSLLETRAPGSGDHDRADHVRLEVIQDELQHRIEQLTGHEDPDTLHILYLDFSRYHSQYLEHIFEEETVTELLLQKHFTDEELMQQRAIIMQHIEFPIMLLWLKYAVPAQRLESNVALLSGFKANAPAGVFDQVMNTIRGEMEEEAFSKLNDRLS